MPSFFVESLSKPISDRQTREPAVYAFSDYAAGAGEKRHVRKLQEAVLYPQNRQPPPRHDFYQIFWMTHGTPSFSIDFYHFPIEAYALVFVSPGGGHTVG